MTLFKNKYRIESSRLKGYDYSSLGEYFITIDSKSMVEWFGTVQSGQMVPNEVGHIVHQLWLNIPDSHDNVVLDDFVVMPNHVHGIIGLTELGTNRRVVCRDRKNDVVGRDANIRVSTGKISKQHGGATGERNPMLSQNSLSFIVRSYKGRVSYEIHKKHPDFAWQARFHDHIIRDNIELDRIREYIRENPGRWEEEKNSPSGLANWSD
jgi:REP element-mobilizing transposase RayT